MCLISFGVFAQESKVIKHYSFLGIEMNMKVDEFAIKLIQEKGYEVLYVPDDSTAYILGGQFAGIEDCKIFVLGTPKTKTVWKVAVSFPDKKSWYSVKSDYIKLVDSYKKKYGKPDIHKEFFTSPYEDGDGYEMTAISLEKCHYITIFEKDDVMIGINIDNGNNRTAHVMVTYEDIINKKLTEKEKNEIIDDDI